MTWLLTPRPMAGRSRVWPELTKQSWRRTELFDVEYVSVWEVGVADWAAAAWKDQLPSPLGLANEATAPSVRVALLS